MSGSHAEHVKKAPDTAASANVEALAHQMPSGGSGEFHAKQGKDAPQTTHGVSNAIDPLRIEPLLTTTSAQARC